jgi:hypothetical protein
MIRGIQHIKNAAHGKGMLTQRADQGVASIQHPHAGDHDGHATGEAHDLPPFRITHAHIERSRAAVAGKAKETGEPTEAFLAAVQQRGLCFRRTHIKAVGSAQGGGLFFNQEGIALQDVVWK